MLDLNKQQFELVSTKAKEFAKSAISAAREAIENSRSDPDGERWPHIVYALCALSTVSFIIWAAVSTLDIVSTANGEVIPSTQLKRIQHLEGGIVSQILIREGGRVKQDQALVVLQSTSSSADVSELQVRLTSLRLDVSRLEALLSGATKPIFEEDLSRDHSKLVSQAAQAFDIAKRRHVDELDRQQQTVQQKSNAIEEIKTRSRNRQRNLGILREQIKISDSLLVDNLTNRYKHLDLMKEESTLEGSIAEDKSALASAESALAEATAGLKSIKSTFDNDNRKALDDARLSLQELSQRMGKFKDNFDRTVIRSPVVSAGAIIPH